MTLSDFDQALRHKYRVESGGAFVPGVTTVLGVNDKPAFKWTSAKIAATTAVENGRRKRSIVPKHRAKLLASRGNSKTSVNNRELGNLGSDNDIYIHFCRGEFDRQWREKAKKGNRVHDVAEKWTKGEAVDVAHEDSLYVDALEKFHRECRPLFHLTECVVLNKDLGYGGRFDTITTLYEWQSLDGDSFEGTDWGWVALGTYLLDYKTGGEYEDSVAMQTIGYMDCKLPVYKNGTLVDFLDLPELDGARIVYLKDDGTYILKDPFANIPQELAREAFQACLTLFKANKKIQSLLGNENDND